MQDSWDNIEDRAWGEMKTILDDHMPRSRRRYWILWTFFGLGILSALVVSYYTLAGEDLNHTSTIHTDDESVAAINSHTQSQDLTIDLTDQTRENETESNTENSIDQYNSGTEVSVTGYDLPDSRMSSKSDNRNEDDVSLKAVVQDSGNSAGNHIKHNYVEAEPRNSLELLKTVDKVVPSDLAESTSSETSRPAIVEPSQLLFLEEIPFIRYDGLQLYAADKHTKIEPAWRVKQTAKRKWNVGLQLLTRYTMSDDALGYGGGLSLEIMTGRWRWELMSNIEVQSNEQPIPLQNAAVTILDDNPDGGSPENFLASAQSSGFELSQLVASQRSLTSQLLLEYQLVGEIYIGSGIGHSYVLDITNFEYGYGTVDITNIGADITNVSKTYLSESDELNRIRWYIPVSLSVDITERLRSRFTYRHMMKPLFQSLTDRDHALTFSIGYMF